MQQRMLSINAQGAQAQVRQWRTDRFLQGACQACALSCISTEVPPQRHPAPPPPSPLTPTPHLPPPLQVRHVLHGVDVSSSRFFGDPVVLAAVDFAAQAHAGQVGLGVWHTVRACMCGGWRVGGGGGGGVGSGTHALSPIAAAALVSVGLRACTQQVGLGKVARMCNVPALDAQRGRLAQHMCL